MSEQNRAELIPVLTPFTSELNRAELIPVLTPFTPFFKTELAELS